MFLFFRKLYCLYWSRQQISSLLVIVFKQFRSERNLNLPVFFSGEPEIQWFTKMFYFAKVLEMHVCVDLKKNQLYRLHGWYQKKNWVLFIFQVVKGGEECIVKFKIPKTFNILKFKHFKKSTIKKEIKYTICPFIYQLYSYKQ